MGFHWKSRLFHISRFCKNKAMKFKNLRAHEICNIKFKPIFAKPAQHRLQRTAAGFPPCGGLRGTAKDHRLPFDGLPRKDRGLCRDRSTTSRFFAERGWPAKAQSFRRVSPVPPLPLSHSVSAPSEAWRFLQGESPC